MSIGLLIGARSVSFLVGISLNSWPQPRFRLEKGIEEAFDWVSNNKNIGPSYTRTCCLEKTRHIAAPVIVISLSSTFYLTADLPRHQSQTLLARS